MTLFQKNKFSPFIICIFIIVTHFSVPAKAATFLEIDADPGEFLFMGKNVNVTDADGDISLFYTAPNQLSGGFTWKTPGANKNNIQLIFYSGTQNPMQVGAYLNAQGPTWFEAQTAPAIDVYLIGAGRVCIPNAGEFIIYEFEPEANPPRYAINFVQDCLYSNQAKIHGILRINSDFPKQNPYPIASISLPATKAIEGKQYSVSAEDSRAQQGEIISYEWRQLSGPEVTFIDLSSAIASITLPRNLPLGGDSVELQLTVTNTAGYHTTTQTSFHVDSKSDPQSFFRTVSGTTFPANPDGWTLNIEQNNLIKAAGGPWGVATYISTSDSKSPDYNVSISPPSNQALLPGLYQNTTRMGGVASAGLDFSANGYGCNEAFGSFEVLSLENEGDLLTQFHARFTHYCESLNAVPTSGEVAYKVLDPNVPKIKITVPQTIIEGDVVTLDASASVDDIGNIQSYQWTGPSNISIKNSDKAIATFNAPAVNGDEPTSSTFKLHVTDNEGYQAEKIVTLTISPNPQASSQSSSTSSSPGHGSGSGGGSLDPWYCIGLMLLLFKWNRKSKLKNNSAVE